MNADMIERAILHAQTLRGAGWSIRSIAAHAGSNPTVVSRMLQHREPTAYAAAAGILKIDPTTIAEKSAGGAEPFVSKVGTVRRIQALLALGWSHEHITERLNRLGIADRRCSCNLLHQPGRWVTLSRRNAVAEVYRDLVALGNGPSERTRRHASKLGYALPGRWENIDLDEAPEPEDIAPDPKPGRLREIDDVVVQRLVEGDKSTRATRRERREAVRRLHAQGLSDGAIGKRLGVTPDGARMMRVKLDLPANPDPRETGFAGHYTRARKAVAS